MVSVYFDAKLFINRSVALQELASIMMTIGNTVIVLITTISLIPYASAVYTTSYNETEARTLAFLSGAAYSTDPQKCVDNLFPPGENWKVVDQAERVCDMVRNKCSAYVVRSDDAKEFIVVFRGTTTSSQLFMQGVKTLATKKKFMDAGKVHPYFNKAVNVLWNRISMQLENEQYRSYPVIFTGHSLGGAMASLAALRTVLEGMRSSNDVKLVTFGQPRVGGKNYVAHHDRSVPYSYRVVYKLDMVPHIPPCTRETRTHGGSSGSKPCDAVSDGFYHHGTEIWYPESMAPGSRYVECLGGPKNEDFNCSDQFIYQRSGVYKNKIADHSEYFDHLIAAYGAIGCAGDERSLSKSGMFKSLIKKASSLVEGNVNAMVDGYSKSDEWFLFIDK